MRASVVAIVLCLAAAAAAHAQYFDPWERPPWHGRREPMPMGPPQRHMPFAPGYPIWAYPGGDRGTYRDGADLYLYRRYYQPREYDPYIWPPPGFR